MREALNGTLLSLLSGLALLATANAGFDLLVPFVPDRILLGGDYPLLRVALARLTIYALIVAVLALVLTWPLGRHGPRRDLSVALPGAACAAVLSWLLAQVGAVHPFPVWYDPARALILFVALPSAAAFWWRRAGSVR